VITEAGRELATKTSAHLNSEVFEVPGLSSEDIADLVRILARLRRDSGDFVDAPPSPTPL
jgi:hypothetical protein